MNYIPLIRNHFNRILSSGIDVYGPRHTHMWLASIDALNEGLPENPYPAKPRVYREISAPNGSNLYWDQPLLAAAYCLSRQTKDQRYADAAKCYVEDFLRYCVSPQNGLFLWGNHFYYDVCTDEVVCFSGPAHETRPLPCAWDIFWKVDPDKTERAIRRMAQQHIKDPETGLFDRHGSVTSTTSPNREECENAHPFLEAGGVLVESLCWLADKTSDSRLYDVALQCARYSFSHRSAITGLVRNQPNFRRWDYEVSTTEIGLWAGCLLQAAMNDDFLTMADESVRAWLRYGYDQNHHKFLGSVNVADGSPASRPETQYAPGTFADLWEPLFPTHNYPMPMAEACLLLWERTQNPLYEEAVHRWADYITQNLPANNGAGAYADQYGRAIHFLCAAAKTLAQNSWLDLAKQIATEAIEHLYCADAGMFRSHPKEDRCDAVDGLGILFLALFYLETGQEPNGQGFHF